MRPSSATHRRGLDVLHSCSFDSQLGWERVGRPDSFGAGLERVDRIGTPRFPDGTNATERDPDLVDDPRRLGFVTANDWKFPGSNIDQGLLWYMFYVRKQVGAYFRYRSEHMVLHWWSHPKPWLVGSSGGQTQLSTSRMQSAYDVNALGRAKTYLGFSSMLNGNASGASPCTRRMWAFRRAIEADERFDELPKAALGMRIPYYPLRQRA